MKSPFTNKEMELKLERRNIVFRKHEFNILYHYYYCPDYDEEITTPEIDDVNLNQVYNQYREIFHIPFPDEIRAIRETYSISANKMSEILGIGINMYAKYENGEIPNESNARLIHLAKDPNTFKDLISLYNFKTKEEYYKLSNTIEFLISEQKEPSARHCFEKYVFGEINPTEYSGFRSPSIEIMTEMVAFFAEKMQPHKTKLNKLLFFADFLQYKKTAFSISGAKYRAIDLGPVPENYNTIFEFICNNNDVNIERTVFAEGIGEKFMPARPTNKCIFTKAQLETLNTVAFEFSKLSGSEIVEKSHEVTAWKDNFKGKNLISYNCGFSLDI